MKKFTEILVDIRKVEAELETVKQCKENLKKDIYDNIIKGFTKERAEHEKEMTANAEKLSELTLALHILRNNAKIAIYNEVVPIAVETFNKYVGKPYGEKTKNKICNEIAKKTHFRCYIRSRYSMQNLEIVPIDFYNYSYGISVGTHQSLETFLIDNKIQKIVFEDLELWYTENKYIEHIQEHVLDLKAAYAQALHARKELENACEKFNTLVVGDIKRIHADDRYYNGII